MNTKSDWEKKETWTKRFRKAGFLVEVSRHKINSRVDYDGGNRWCIYAYIYPTHPHFKAFDGTPLFQDATNEMPLHGGASYLYFHESEGVTTSIQVGCDYNHLGGDNYTHCDTKEAATQVFKDAEVLIEWLNDKATKETTK